mmetsp:Transcript_28921/g.82213  ORF Transcript_28921/g.82213 Transcript_28921/m.82213 type:complete len:483 (-) Transcript_28921:104-1552(-)
MGGNPSRPPADGGGGAHALAPLPPELLKYVAAARGRLEKGLGVLPCEHTGELHDNSSGHLRGFSTPAAKRQWFDKRISQLKDVGSDILSRWEQLDADFVMHHASLSGAPMPPYQSLRATVHARMEKQAAMYREGLAKLPKEELQPILDFEELWPPRLPQELKELCIQPDEAFTMRLGYAAGLPRLELLYLFSAGLAKKAGLDPGKVVQWSVKRPSRLQNKATMLFPAQCAVNDYRRSTDVYRTQIVADTCKQIKLMLSVLECLGRETFDRVAPLRKIGIAGTREHLVVERIQNRFARPALGGYPDVLVSLRISGYVCEIQLHLRALEALSGESGRALFKWFKHFSRDAGSYALTNQEPEDAAAQGSTHYQTGGRYTGETVDGKRHGKGTFYYNSGDRYEGQWVDGAKHGAGTFYYSAGDRYIGEWKDDRMHGHGKFVSHSGETFEGIYLNGLRHGGGTQTNASGETFVGSWWKNKRCDTVTM